MASLGAEGIKREAAVTGQKERVFD